VSTIPASRQAKIPAGQEARRGLAGQTGSRLGFILTSTATTTARLERDLKETA
jgi:hypothetical protein